METSDQLPEEITVVLSLVENQSADWTLTKRNGRYSMQIKWRQTTQKPTITTKKRSSKARQDRNRRRRQAFLLRKQQESGEPTINTEEQGPTAPPPVVETKELPSPAINDDMDTGISISQIDRNLSAKQTIAEEKKINTQTSRKEERTTTEVDPAQQVVDSRSEVDKTLQKERKKRQLDARSYTKGLKVKKVCLDLPQTMYVMDIADNDLYLLVNSNTLEFHDFIYKDQDEDTYQYIKRSFDTWLDVRNSKNFLFSQERMQAIVTIANKYKLKLV
ncbi:Hypothetical predicted protein [Mytilus galloprovincialis]|uniref:Uncharacterized protein n=1 Tax=Mytilus galloprovincialis TaxID=29158 RepID=A0A8B6CDK6_MYTGA|nr:Hypothetical predicted protein [Mytilus galloprovincialis]